MTRWLPLLFLLSGLALAAEWTVLPESKTLVIRDMCVGTTWKAYRTKGGDLWVGCGDAVPPSGAVELRAYYVLPSGGPRR